MTPDGTVIRGEDVQFLAAMAEPLNETSALCMNCGLCCNGAIYEDAPVNPDEADFAAAAGFEITQSDQGLRFRQPCTHLCGSACTIYDQPRPSICGDFFCRLARRLNNAEIGFAEAEGRVKVALGLIEQIRPLLREGEDLAQARKRWAAMNHPARMSADDARFALLMTALNRQIDRHFRYDFQSLLRTSGASMETGVAGENQSPHPSPTA